LQKDITKITLSHYKLCGYVKVVIIGGTNCKSCADIVKEENRERYRSKLSTKITEANKSKEFDETYFSQMDR